MEMWLKIAISRQNSYIQPEIQTVNGFRAQKLLEGQPILKGANIHLNISQSLPIPIVNTYRVYWSILYLSFSWIMRSFSLKGGFCPLDYLNENNKSTYYFTAAAAAAKSLQLCPTLRTHRRQPTRLHHPLDSWGKNTGVGCHFLLQCMKVKSESEVAHPWTAAYQAPPSMGFSRQEYWSGSPLPSPYYSTRLKQPPLFLLLSLFLPPSLCLSLNKRWPFYKEEES